MVEVIPITSVHTVSLPLTGLGPDPIRFFAIVTSASARAGDRRAASIATTIENLASQEDHPARPTAGSSRATHPASAWLSAYIRKLQEHLHRERADATEGIGICVGVAFTNGSRTSLSFIPAGGIAAFAVAGGARRTPTIVPIIEPPTTASLRFSHTSDGTIGPHDAIVIGTATLARDDIRQSCALAFTRHVITDAIVELRHLLPKDVGAAVITCTHTAPPRSQRSMDTFLATATSTERFLTPRLGPMLHQYVTQLRSTTSLVIRKRSRRAPRHRLLPLIQHAMRLTIRTVVVAARSIGAMVVDGLRLLSIAVIRCIHAVQRMRARRGGPTRPPAGGDVTPPLHSPDGSRRVNWKRFLPFPLGGGARGGGTAWRALRNTLTTKTTSFRVWYSGLPSISQRLFLLTVLFAVLFFISTGALWRRRTHETTVTAYNTTIATIEELRSVAEARLLFGDRSAARDALRDAEAALAMLPRTSRARRERAVVLDGEIRAALDRARLVTRIQQPLRVGRGGEGGISFAEIGNLSVVGAQLVAAAADGSAVAVLDPRGGATKSYDLAAAKLPSRPLRALTLDDRSVMLIDAGAHAVRVDVRSGSAAGMIIEQPPPGIRDAALFQGRLYLLHADGEITRHARTTGGFGRGTTWLQASNAPPNTQRLLVAGPVFLASGDGALAVYFAGRKRDTDLRKDIDPPLFAAAHLAAPPDQDLLYLGDPTEGRIIALKTNGELVGQIQSDTFRNMTDLAIDPTGAAIYVLHGNEISVVVPPKSQ